LSGTGTTHACTDHERNYLFQLGPDMLQVPGSDGDKLQNGYWSATTCGATAWLCPDQNVEVRPRLLDRKGERLPMSALSGVGISGWDGPAGSEVESVDDPHDESSWAPMTR